MKKNSYQKKLNLQNVPIKIQISNWIHNYYIAYVSDAKMWKYSVVTSI